MINCSGISKWYHCGDTEKLVKNGETIPLGFEEGRAKAKTKADYLSDKYSRDVVYNDYITMNKSKSELMVLYETDSKTLGKLFKMYGIQKSAKESSKYAVRQYDHTDYVERGKKSSQTQREAWKNKTQEEIDAWSDKMSSSHKTSNYAKIKAMQNSEYRKSLTDEENDRQNSMRSASMQKWWGSLSEEEKQHRVNASLGSGAGYHSANSKPNLKFMEYLTKNGIEFNREFRIGKYSYDFKVGNNLIEINPSVTHNSTWSPFGKVLDKYYHRDKTKCAVDNGYRCIHVFDWDSYDSIVRLLLSRTRIYARDCEVVEVSTKDAIDFLSQHHLQGYAKSTIQYGLTCRGTLVSIMTFDKPRYNNNYDYELIRYCSSYDVVGGSEKLFSHFMRDHRGCSVISYCDESKFSGNTYNKLGFKFKSSSVSRHWYNPKTEVHITDNLLRQRGFDQLFGCSYGKGISNEELMVDNGFVAVYDAGQSVYVYDTE